MAKKEKDKDSIVNPIDADKISENPGLLPYAHHLGSAIIAPIDEGRTKGLAMAAMYEQTETQLVQIKEQIDVLVRQAKNIHERITLSEIIYQADLPFEPVIGKTYHLYKKKDRHFLSLVGPEEWGPRFSFDFVSSVKLLSDHTWEVL